MTTFHALMLVDHHHSLLSLFVFFYPYFIPPFHSTSYDFILFSSCLMFDIRLVHTHHNCLFDVSIHLSSLFVWRSLGPGLMTFSTHCISCTKGMGIISLGSLSLVSFHFLSFPSPYYLSLRYVLCLKTTLRL